MTEHNLSEEEEAMRRVRERFLELTGVPDVKVERRMSGPEVFYDIVVGRRAPIYDRARARINDELGPGSPLYGSLTMSATDGRRGLQSMEVQALRALIRKSLEVRREQLAQRGEARHVPFASGEDNQVLEPTHHVIWGRRGVGKSSLILHACKGLGRRGDAAAWIGAEAYRGREDNGVLPQVLDDVLRELSSAAAVPDASRARSFEEARGVLAPRVTEGLSERSMTALVHPLKQCLRSYYEAAGHYYYIFLDDAHMIDVALQPFVFQTMVNLFGRGGGGVVNIAGVKKLMNLSDPRTGTGLQIPDDVHSISLDRTLVNPSAAKEHLEKVLLAFLEDCGFGAISNLLRPQAVERLVWCSAGVPRDFLWLVERAVGYAIERGRSKVGREEVNRATGELSNDKLDRLARETPKEEEMLRHALESLQRELLDDCKRNCFLVRDDPQATGYQNLQKLVDLRLVHLIHPSITPSRAGERYQAYLLDYSFYTGVRRRQRLSELKVEPGEPPKYAELRKLPRLEPSLFAGTRGA